MKENKYDDEIFFRKYSEMNRSKQGLKGAGEWSELQKVLPTFEGLRVLDLGCGYGWHCLYAAQKGASSVLGVDISCSPPSIRFLPPREPRIGITGRTGKSFIFPWIDIFMRGSGMPCF